jgi:hypothetical protein
MLQRAPLVCECLHRSIYGKSVEKLQTTMHRTHTADAGFHCMNPLHQRVWINLPKVAFYFVSRYAANTDLVQRRERLGG